VGRGYEKQEQCHGDSSSAWPPSRKVKWGEKHLSRKKGRVVVSFGMGPGKFCRVAGIIKGMASAWRLEQFRKHALSATGPKKLEVRTWGGGNSVLHTKSRKRKNFDGVTLRKSLTLEA